MPRPHGTKFALSAVSIRLAVLVFGFTLTLSACQKGDSESGESSEGAPADSSAVEAGEGSDSTSTEGSNSWKDRLFGGEDEEPEEETLIPVETAAATTRDIPAFLSSTATLEPDKRADLIAKSEGTIHRIRVEEGDWVKEGQILADLDGATAAVELEEATARARGLRLDLERIERLSERELSSEKALQDAKAAYEQAEALRKGAALRSRYTKIRAPFSGIISARLVDPGQHVSVGTAVFSLVDSTPLLARIYLPEAEVLALQPNQLVWIEPDNQAEFDDRIRGSVLRIAPIVDTRTGTVKVTCQVGEDTDEPSAETRSLRPGSFVRVLIQTGIHEQVLSIPKRAIVPEGADSYVFRAEADSVVKIMVATGFTDADFIEIIEGIEENDLIITVGHGGLETGSKIDDLSNPDDSKAAESTPDTDTAAKDQ